MADWSQWEAEQARQKAEIEMLAKQNAASQGQVASTPYFGGSAYDPAAAQAGTGRGALSIRGNEIGYFGNGQWNSLGAAPQNGTPEFLRFVQQAAYEGDQEAPMMAAQANMPAPTTKSYGYAQPPSWAPRVNTSDPTQSNFLGGLNTGPTRTQLPYGDPSLFSTPGGTATGWSEADMTRFGNPYPVSGTGQTPPQSAGSMDYSKIVPYTGYFNGSAANTFTPQQGPSSIPSQTGMLNQQPFTWNGAPVTQTAPKPQGASFNPYMNNFFTSYWGK